MKSIGPRFFKCEEGERVTLSFSPDPDDCAGLIEYVFDRDDNTLGRVGNGRLIFTAVKDVTVLDIWYFFDPAQEDGVCNITLTGNAGGTFPDLVRFSEIPPILTYTFAT